MERFILWECELFEKKQDITTFLLWFKALKTEEKESYVLSVIKEYGVNSKQFYFVVQGFIFYVMFRHGLYWDEDVFQEAFLSVIEKVKYWDKKKGNLLSFLYSLIRDKVSQRKYWMEVKMVRGKEFEEGYMCRSDDEERDELYEYDEESKLIWQVMLREVSNSVVKGLRNEVLDSILRGDDTVYRRAVLWHVMSEERCIDEMV
jgi:DNA-directed RNA polymerase specialized sigma24 family protein